MMSSTQNQFFQKNFGEHQLAYQLEIPSLDQLLFKYIDVFMYKQSKNKNPALLSKIFVNNRSQYSIRNKSNI